ncbi:DUF1565 domain-containing protein [Pantanalinema sp. GBBB05]|uniref:DUF1565 domain-containing protein n=1 Tax=Pantanalinema sp. GBBB05 TaxID=2604139 RepID=UPI001D310074|nr:DUF1565 domain-containing protein [Pantanalinema sp. GBBB05]
MRQFFIPKISGVLQIGMLVSLPLGYGWFGTTTQAMPVPSQPSIQLAQATPTSYTVLMVNPNSGNDYTADGSNLAPFRSLTKALQVAQPNTIILLTPGTYSSETGEVFPIALKPGVTIQGDVPNRGQMVVIQGGGKLISPTAGRQNVTIIGANQAMLAGVTVMNSESQGNGLWLESTSPIVVHNTFTANGQSGIAISGNSQATIRDNYFSRNHVNGIRINDTSRPEVRENLLEQTGVAIQINQQATPLIISNRIRQNRIGISVQAAAQPVVRQNLIEGQTEAGLVAIAQAQPNLGTAAEPGNNVFRNNTQADINAEAASQAIVAYGNDLVKAMGRVVRESAIAAQPPSKPSNDPPSNTPASPPAVSRPVLPIASSTSTNAPAVASDFSAAAFPTPTALNGSSGSPTPVTPRPMQVIVRAAPPIATAPISPLPTLAPTIGQPRPVIPLTVAAKPQPVRSPLPPRPLATINPAVAATADTPIDIPVPAPEVGNTTVIEPIASAPTVTPLGSSPSLPETPATSLPTIAVAAPKTPTPITANLPAVGSQRSLPALPIIRSTPPVSTQSAPVLTQPAPMLTQPTPVLAPRSTPVLTPPDSLAAQAASIEIPVPPPESGVVAPVVVRPSSPPPGISSSITTAEAPKILPVPGGDIPIGNIGDMPQVYVARSGGSQTIDSPPIPPNRSFVVVRYRVVVDAIDDSQQAQVKSIVPGAFAVSHGGRMVMQAGAFGDRSKADELMQILVAQGLKASVESME